MGGPNRKLRRAMEAQQRKAAKNQSPVAADALKDAAVLQRMYDQRTMQAANLERELLKAQALLAGSLIELDVDEVTISAETLEALQEGAIEGLNRTQTEDGGVTINVIYVEDDEDAADEDEANDDEAE